MRQLSDTNNDLKKLQTSSESEDSPYCKSSVSMLEMQLPLQKQLLAKLYGVNFYMNSNLTKNITKVKNIYMLLVFLAPGS